MIRHVNGLQISPVSPQHPEFISSTAAEEEEEEEEVMDFLNNDAWHKLGTRAVMSPGRDERGSADNPRAVMEGGLSLLHFGGASSNGPPNKKWGSVSSQRVWSIPVKVPRAKFNWS